MKILLLVDEQGSEVQLYRASNNDLTLKVTDSLHKQNINYLLDKEDIESLICELARLRDIPF